MSPPPSSSPGKRGIDVRDALSILSARADAGGDSDVATACGPSSVPEELRGMGQTIDISEQMEFANQNKNLGCDCASIGNDGSGGGPSSSYVPADDEEMRRHEAMRAERERRGEKIREELSTMGVSDLLGTIFRAQQDRVATYKAFDDGLSTILASGNMTTYPSLCAKVTASFSVLSDTINAVKSTLEAKHGNRKDITSVIVQLQNSEREKLNLTAALHLEKLRLRNTKLEAREEEADGRTERLLEEGIRTMERKIGSAVESINEALDELRCIAADEA